MNYHYSKCTVLTQLLLGACLCLASAGSAQAVELSIKNELKDYESGNTLLVEDGRSIESPKTRFRIHIYPGKTVQVTKGNVQSFVLVRPFVRHKLKYEITCPKSHLEDSATVTLLEIHKNTLPYGCQVERLGHWSSRGGMKWTDVKQKHEQPHPSVAPALDTDAFSNESALNESKKKTLSSLARAY